MTSPSLDADLLAILACPETKEPVALADDALLQRINAAIEAGKLANKDGQALDKTLEAALVRQDGKLAYPVRGGIPIMLVEEGFALDELA
ncbi:MAG: hypothetical protein DRQ55_12185 [Planctomycetota bacterium]|nr:MAG: hypothetical protein DRQ55_12185 [Planctomycetota bacterium]